MYMVLLEVVWLFFQQKFGQKIYGKPTNKTGFSLHLLVNHPLYLLKSSLLKHHKYFIISLFLAAECTFLPGPYFTHYRLQIAVEHICCVPQLRQCKGFLKAQLKSNIDF